MKLEDIKPPRSSFKLSSNNKEYFIRPFTLEDEIWAKNTLGDDIDNIFRGDSVDFDQFTRLIYRVIGDKSDFKKVTSTTYDDDGDEIELSIGGYKKFQTMVYNMDDKISILKAFNEVMAKSRPEIKAGMDVKDTNDKKKG